MKKLFILFPVWFFILSANAQTTPSKDIVIKTLNDIGDAVIDYYHPQADSVKDHCWCGCVFIRFTINKNGEFTNIDYTAKTPIFIKDALMSAFESINKKAPRINQLPKICNSEYILPVIIYNRDGCGFMTGWEDKNYKPDEKTKEMYARRQDSYDQSMNSLLNMLNFFKGKTDSVNCILLAPVNTGYVMY
ncbi:hypothetical protein [Mucilaginibacter paludis]|uniref:TonB C-terminal domain-containing protein n=1 Tax=Mucilaginibacter paludis DSM 18603 TaxID=714943 RepID=H1YB93_9SPHI|nr:hypothetical protein [Mucilaginibacter paludis]EHQ30619.1 hypothetical protein Mucpa_6567 [Mucilaginibacter paludis DSM 18603]